MILTRTLTATGLAAFGPLPIDWRFDSLSITCFGLDASQAICQVGGMAALLDRLPATATEFNTFTAAAGRLLHLGSPNWWTISSLSREPVRPLVVASPALIGDVPELRWLVFSCTALFNARAIFSARITPKEVRDL